MFLKRFYNEKLAQASYLVGCPGAGEAIVIDPNREVDSYIRAAEEEGLRITGVTETHIHADYLSGSRELAEKVRARLYLSDEGDADWKYAFAGEPNVELVREGDSIQAGAAKLDVLKTSGHTPEHISFLITDLATSPQPFGLFTGDFIFVGDVGRPDLLENAAGIQNTARPGAEALYESLQRASTLPEHLLIWPGHGAGSACGKSLGGVPVSSLGYEKLANWAFKADRVRFVEEVLAGQPDPPPYFAEMKRQNKLGPALLGEVRTPPLVSGRLPTGALLIDVRESEEYFAGHNHGAMHLPHYKSFLKWAGWFVTYRTDLYLIANTAADAHNAAKDLALIGLDDVRGWLMPNQESATSRIRASELNGSGVILDVRTVAEWQEDRIKGSVNIPLNKLPKRTDDLPKDVPIFVHCESGTRSAIASSILEAAGFTRVVNVEDGFDGYRASHSS